MIKEINIPKNWKMLTISDVCSYIQRGKQPEYDNSGRVKIINQRCIYWDGIKLRNTRNLDQDHEENWQKYRYLQQRDVLLNSTGEGTLGRAQIWDVKDNKDYVVDGHVTILRGNDLIEPSYLFRFLQSPFGQNQIEAYTKGSTGQTELYKKHIKNIEIPVPPKKEQREIIDSVEKKLEQIDRLTTAVENIGRLSDEYRDSHIAYLSSGLSSRYEGELKAIPDDSDLPKDWSSVELSKVANINPRISHVELDEYAYIPMDAVSAKTQTVKRFDRRESVYSSLARFEQGDILLARITPCFENGKIAIVPDLPDGFDFAVGSSEFAVIRPENINREYLFIYLTSPIVKQWGEQRLLGATGRERINISQIRNELRVPLPPEEAQKDIVEKIKSTSFNRIRRSVDNLKIRFNEYENSILAHAYQGDIGSSNV